MSENMEKCKQIFAQGSETAGWNGCIIHDALFHINEWLKCYDMFITGVIPIAIGGVAVYCTVQALKLTREQSQLAQQQAHEATIINAWNVLTTPAPGSSGKKEAIETLVAAGKNLNGIDLSIERNGGVVELEKLRIEIKHPENTRFRTALSLAKFHGAYLAQARFCNVWLHGVKFHNADLHHAEFDNASLRNAEFYGADLTRTKFNNCMCLGVQNFDENCWVECAQKDSPIYRERESYREEMMQHSLPIFTGGGCRAIFTDRPHKDENGKPDGYYINIVKA